MTPLNNTSSSSSSRITIVSSIWLRIALLLVLLQTTHVEAFQQLPWCHWRRPGGGGCGYPPLCPNDNNSGDGGAHHVPPSSTELPTCDATSSSSPPYHYYSYSFSSTSSTTALSAVSPFSSMTAQETLKMNKIQTNDDSDDHDRHDHDSLEEEQEYVAVRVGAVVQSSTKRKTTTTTNDSSSTILEDDEETVSLQQQQAQDEQRRQLLMIFFATATATSSSGMLLLRPANAAAATAATLVESSSSTAATATATAGVGVQILADDDAIVKAPLDSRQYRAITLPENGLRILLCSDPSTNEAAVAMNVHVGATSDPATIPGLAHFTEHMLFLGTREYPLENSFEAFLSKTVGGMSNAYTDSEDTVYFFHMETASDMKLLQEGLSRFQSFFSAPLFTESATSRELNAIESEHSKNLQTDSFRSFQLEKLRANPAHPFSKFYTGNKYTLLDNTKVKGIDLRQALIDFYTRYYSANQMTLAVVAPQSLDELQDLVVTSTSKSQSSSSSSFGKIPNRNNPPPPEQSWAGRVPPFSVSASSIPSFQHVVEAVPVQDLRQVDLSWPIVYASPEQARDVAFLYKANTYIAHLLGHEGPNSLLSYLKRQGWANSISSGAEEELIDFQKFAVVLSLTTTGLAKLDQVVEAVYSYIAMLRGGTSGTNGVIPVYILKEVLQLDELQWRFLTPGRPRNYATSLATAMQKYPPEYYVAGPRRLALDNDNNEVLVVDATPRNGFSSAVQLARTNEQVQDFLSQLTVSNGLITVLSKSFEGMTDRKEEIYGTLYRVRPVSEQALEKWNKPTPAKQLRMDFPRPNPFIPTEIGLRVKIPPSSDIRQERASDRSFESRLTPISPPRKIRQDDKWTVYFKQDDRFGKPKAYVILQILTKQVFATAQRAALSNLLEISIADRLQEYAYDAGLASLSYEVKVLPRGIRLTFGGYNDKLQEFASYISSKLSRTSIRKLLPRNDNEFYRYKDQIMRALSAFDVKQPYFHASYYGQITLQPRRFQYTNRELLDETRNLVFSDLLLYADILWTNGGRGEALVQGNVNEREALGIVRSIGDALAFGPVPDSEVPPRLEVLPLPPSAAEVVPTRMLLIEPNAANENSVGYIMLQCLGKSEKEHVLMELLASIVQEPFYDNLRTKKQLGYIVSSGVRGLANTRTLSFVVQSSVAPSAVLTLKILEFLDSVEAMLEKLTPANLAVYCKSLIEGKTERDKDLTVEVERNWGEISSGRLQFDRLQREAAALIDLDKGELIEFWQRIFVRDGRRALIVEMIPRQGSAASVLPPTTTGYQPGDDNISGLVLGIDDIAQFRRDLERELQQSQQQQQQQEQQQQSELPLPEDELLIPTTSS